MIFQYVLGELGIEALAYAQNSPFIHSFVHSFIVTLKPEIDNSTHILLPSDTI